jgi:oxaloacetate decarboxylase (Na+ extruding) subunit alpha
MAFDFIDTTLRDGNQSLWGATGLTTAMMLRIAPDLDRVGYRAIDFSTSTHMAMAVRYHREDPWERLRLVRQHMPRTPLAFLSTGMRFISWETAHPELMRLSYRLLVRNGIRRFQVMDPMNAMDAVVRCARDMRAEGGEEIVAALVYTVSPVHDDAWYARCAQQLAPEPSIDRIYLKDPGGLLTAERARTLLPALQAACGGKPLELHSHCTIGLAPFSYEVAAACGIDTLHTAARPLANGSSQPAIENIAANLAAAGRAVELDLQAQARVSATVYQIARAQGLAPGVPQEYDARYFQHQLPGGMIGTMRRQLRELRQEHRLDEVYEEVARVRADLGYPIMVTPFSQVVGTLAVLNVLSGERYAKLPDEVIRYVIGRFGTPPQPVAPEILDRVERLPRARELAAQPPMPELSQLRRRLGPHLEDEEFLLRAVMPAEQVDAMKAAGPAARQYDPALAPALRLVEQLSRRHDLDEVRIEKDGFRLLMRRVA